MLKGFEKETSELNEYEINVLVPAFIEGFKGHYGLKNSITNKTITQRMKGKFKGVTDVRVRKVINYLRITGLVPGLIATSSGYYISTCPDEVAKYILSLQGRENEIRLVKNVFIQYHSSLINP